MKSFVILLMFLIPLVWSSYVNANYLSTKTFLIYFVSGLCLMALPGQLNIRKIPQSLGILLSMIFLYYVSFFAVEGNWDSIFYIFKMLSFVAITLFVYSQSVKLENFFENTTYLFFLMWAVIIGITGYEIFNFRVLQEDIRTIAILSTFGNVNMMSEFFVLALPLF